ncbi:hypothetical protein ANO11243_069240 [Dothideomycetidae sp. 11243]|nr:hypothetical protein ANO11243_069240 [fungal sp. No.11243]
MNPDLTPLSSEASPEWSSRRDRAAVAAQACETCRTRSVWHNDLPDRPCSSVKDKTLVHILQALERVESKVDRISTPSTGINLSDTLVHGNGRNISDTGPTTAKRKRINSPSRHEDSRSNDGYMPADVVDIGIHMTASHRILVWPAVYLMLTNSSVPVSNDLDGILQEGSHWFTQLDLKKSVQPLPGPKHGPVESKRTSSGIAGLAGLSTDSIRRLSDAYFDTFNMVHPILDRTLFYSDVIGPAIGDGLEMTDFDTTCCLALAVLALGQVAIEGISGAPVASTDKWSSGIRGGTIGEPPGLDLFNEGRQRFGYVMHSCSLENVQIYLLHAMYYESCARHIDYWRCCAAASMAFQVYIRCARIDWSTPRADMIKRVYWTCILNEDIYHLELGLPRTSIYSVDDRIPLPSFVQSGRFSPNEVEEKLDQFHYHFLAMIALRRLIARIHSTLHSDAGRKAESSRQHDGPPLHLINELARQLESWRTYLPQVLQWSDNDAHDYPNINPLARHQPGPLFTTEDNGNYGFHKHNLDIVTAFLRTKFYYARYLIYRPFIFKALHFPETMTEEDNSYCALAIQSICLWPFSMYPCRDKKRHVPHLFSWTQNFVGILIILRMTTESECLARICRERVNRQVLHSTVALLLDWIKDISLVDAMAEWSWKMLEPLFADFRSSV